MTVDRKRPDPRLKGLPPGYDWEFVIKPEESKEEFEARVLARGDAAKRLLRDPDFNAAYHELLEENLQQIVTSKPAQRELREDAYFRIRGTQEVAYKMHGWVQMAEQLAASLTGESDAGKE